MTNIDEIVTLLLIKFNLEEGTILKPCTKIFPGVTAAPLFKSLIVTASINEAAELLNCSGRTIQRVLRTLFPPKSERGGSQRQYLLEYIEHKYCGTCERILSIDQFSKSKSKCKECAAETFKAYYLANKSDIINKVSVRNALKISRIPKWADISKIKEVYQKCPKGFHVDHVVPLQGKLVSGLHVEYNLQYLPAEENIRKSNTWEVS